MYLYYVHIFKYIPRILKCIIDNFINTPIISFHQYDISLVMNEGREPFRQDNLIVLRPLITFNAQLTEWAPNDLSRTHLPPYLFLCSHTLFYSGTVSHLSCLDFRWYLSPSSLICPRCCCCYQHLSISGTLCSDTFHLLLTVLLGTCPHPPVDLCWICSYIIQWAVSLRMVDVRS